MPEPCTFPGSSYDSSYNGSLYTSMHRHDPDAQREMHPNIAEGADWNGVWVVCNMVESDSSEGSRTPLKLGLEDWVEDQRHEGEKDGRFD